MSERLSIPLHAVQAEEVPIVGSKAAALAKLLQAGFSVPDGIAVTTHAFSLATAPFREAIGQILGRQAITMLSQADAASNQIGEILTGWRVPDALMIQLQAEAGELLAQRLVVRSSAAAEDQPEVTYAGQYTSLLGVSGFPALESAIITCWKSYFSPHALLMRAEHDAPLLDDGMALILQPFIDAECAGVCFTADPVRQTGDLVINAAWGLGPGVADGTAASDTYRVHARTFEVFERHIVHKPERIAAKANSVLEAEPVQNEWQQAACLPDAWARIIAQIGIAAQTLFGAPQDIEWAIAGGQVWLLQSRPLTALGDALRKSAVFPLQELDARGVLWRLREGGPILPLEQVHVRMQEEMREETCRFMGADRNQALIFVNGRAYTRPLRLDITPGDMRIRRQAQTDLQRRLRAQGLTSWDYWGPEIVTANERLRAFEISDDGELLAAHLEDAIAVRRRHYMLHPMCGFTPPAAYFEVLQKVASVSETEARTLGYQFLEGEPTPLTELIDRLDALAEQVRAHPRLKALVHQPPKNLFYRLDELPEAATFKSQFSDLLAEYGERTGDGYGSETTIAAPTWREQPEQMLKLIAAYGEASGSAPSTVRASAREQRSARIEALCRACEDEALVQQFQRELAYARKCFAVLEIHNHHIDQAALGFLRQAVIAAAHWLVDHKCLSAADDVLWLDFDEIVGSLRHPGSIPCAEIIVDRQRQFGQWSDLQAPVILGLPDANLSPRPSGGHSEHVVEIDPLGVLYGTGASAGIFKGRAYVIDESAQELPAPERMSGVILVAKNIGPRWTPYFPLIGALVLDGGAIGQHAAAAAREYGIPAVVETRHATRFIQNGTEVAVNGMTGTVEYPTS
ncbi:MAG TPA: PEP/pyruvate-binding domain-containing protein [Candidatus Limnocylindrales bacterium]|nr:PEP/pyruvate-binding domain-containing protein [Candidatus Limnocylindrales bacterium]